MEISLVAIPEPSINWTILSIWLFMSALPPVFSWYLLRWNPNFSIGLYGIMQPLGWAAGFHQLEYRWGFIIFVLSMVIPFLIGIGVYTFLEEEDSSAD